MIRPLHTATGLISAAVVLSQSAVAQEEAHAAVRADVVSFRNAQAHMLPRMDIYTSVPYQLLQFSEQEGTYVAEFKLRIEVRDTAGRTYIDSTYTKTIVENNYSITRGSKGTADNSLKRYTLAPNSYVIDVTVADAFAQRTFQVRNKHRILNFDDELPSLSSVLFVSDIEQRGSRYSIVPFIGDIVQSNEQRLFAFFEYYSDHTQTRAAFSWQLLSEDLRIGASGITEPSQVQALTSQHFFPIVVPQRLIPGTYTLLVRAHPALADGTVDTTTTLTDTKRYYRVPRTLSNDLLADLRKSIKQMIYVAPQDVIDSMLATRSDGERLSMFENFWKGLDPTPSTATNEALEEYYQRITTANTRFRSYNEGWLTDMGRVYIIYGEPLTIERFLGPNRLSVYSRWTYGNGLTVTFEDPSGFGDFRLRSPLPGRPKYEYGRAVR